MTTLKPRPLICLPKLRPDGRIEIVHNSPSCQQLIIADRECVEKLFEEIAAVLQRTGTA